ncbi:type IV toxin-antitoxin system AbiEi family antitoxin domain-containing protein [Nocardioides sp. QY071]|uniref:type IV toxin-antitoxin system AbiEi family antitoxin domain-containing protein n=1 Tax=Nocardioides sp. QY071 TaxID=3044187 RepID=UPI00249B35C6|nr:type IV toxin-antitoxin system AbiEi family antitoxin domain-containing protein [Nocardioides sp. QY071]WGY03123.1 type IV toxin-antitoxin system AbiEi family antitoxin domain-containing protein [Nocardioides sp. QY071]
MNARVVALMSAQGGLVTRRQAMEAGMAGHQIDGLLRSGSWVTVRRGVYAEKAYVDALTTDVQRRVLADRAASLRVDAPHVLSHHSSAHLQQLEVLHERKPITHVGRPGIVGSHLRHGVKHHLAPYRGEQVVLVDGFPALDLARTSLDIAREHGYLQGLVAADSALRAGATRVDLSVAAAAMRHWPYVTVVDDVVASTSPLTDSVAETLGRDFVSELGYGVPQPQFGLTADGRTAWCDLRLGRHFFEIDSKLKLRPAHAGGLSLKPPEETLWDEKLRQDFVTGFKTGVSRLTWNDFFGRGRTTALERCRREFLDTCSRFGTDVSDLAQFRPRGPKPRVVVQRGPVLPRWSP